ncbi:sodium/potassium/calcium exchanger 1 isoform X3 [Bubalus bubalis]|uniref:sodium/potassium/calcium exchanger 1 isoform X3 n=1 Tax=Bubalus bubalis TaxID=89462 RepID=UPI001E1B7798|nr:sodium/potassium/calcium exchanger 1 isoform X3 [Bubalus bubalis]
MGKLIRMRAQERRSLWPKRLHWSRPLFLLGMLIIGSTYQYMTSPQDLPTLWAAVSSQHPVKVASRDLSNKEMMMVSSETSKSSSEMEVEAWAPEATAGRDGTPPGIARKNTPSTPRGTASITPTIPNNYSPTPTGTGKVKEDTSATPSGVLNHYTQSRPMVNSYTRLTPRGEVKSSRPTQSRGKEEKYSPSPLGRMVNSYAPSTLMTMPRSHGITPRTTVKDREIMATKKMLATNPSKRLVEKTTPAPLKGITDNTPTFLLSDLDTDTLTSPRNVVEKKTLTTPRRVDSNSSTNHQRLVGKNNLTTPQGMVLEHTAAVSEGQVTISTMTRSSPAETKASTDAWKVRNPLSRTSAPTIRISSATFRGLLKSPSKAPSTPEAPRVRANPTIQVRHCLVVEPAPVAPTAPSPSWTTAVIPGIPSPSGQPDLHPKAEYPRDLFSVEERRQGWVVLHIFGMMYVFVALAIVCDEYFVPALGVITDKLQISEDVAGATFMAAGGSAPELFTSLIGVFISHSNVGIGTIVGSAVFNILFVIGTCALFSREILNLTWWPLFRDITFYIFDLMMLILFFLDSLIAWWESVLLLLAYAFYVFTMKWNQQLELWVKEQLNKRPVAKVMALGDLSKPGDGTVVVDEQQDNKKLKLSSMLTRGSSSASLHNSTIRSTIYQLMLHSLDPLGEEEEPAKLPAVTVTPAPAPDVKGDQEEDPGSQGVGAEAENAGERTGGEAEAPAEGENGERSGGDAALGAESEGKAENESEGDIPAERRGDDEDQGEIQAEAGEVEGEIQAGEAGEVEGDEDEGEIQAGEAGEVEGDEDEGEIQAGEGGEVQGDEDEGEIQAGEAGEVEGEDGEVEGGEDEGEIQAGEGGEGETGEQELNAEIQGEAKDDEEGLDGEGGGDGGDSEDEEEEDEEEEDEEEEDEEEEEEENEQPLFLEWPETRRKQAIYLFLLPIVFPLWLTVPDVRRLEAKKFFVITFLGSILWIAMFSYLMVWWAHQVGETIGISEEIMGLTILAAGTSIPDLITSVIVARKGLGDMAVSSSVGSNIFDITVGLPLPWMLFSLISGLQPVAVSSNGLFCAIVLLFLMLLFVISSIALCKWRMNKILGFTMFLLYFVFLIISVMLEDRIISCPVSV